MKINSLHYYVCYAENSKQIFSWIDEDEENEFIFLTLVCHKLVYFVCLYAVQFYSSVDLVPNLGC